MKKNIRIIFVLLSICFLTACSNERNTIIEIGNSDQENAETSKGPSEDASSGEKEWTVDDFSIYDSEGNLYDYALDSKIELSKYKEDTLELQTARGVKIHDKAKVALADCDFTGFYIAPVCYPVLRSNTEEENVKGQEFLDKYSDINEAVKHTSELYQKGLSLYVSCYFYEEDGMLYPYELKENGNPVDYEQYRNEDGYFISMRIVDDEIYDITLEHKTGYKNK